MEFNPTDIPEDFVNTIPEPDLQASSDPTCEVCGTALVYAGRGRKPKFCEAHKSKTSTRGTARVSSDVDSALVILGGMYDGLAMGLMFVSANAATQWAQNADKLQASNRVTLAADPKLCKRINNIGRSGGSFAFVTAHAIAIAPIVAIVRDELREKAQMRALNEQVGIAPDFSQAQPGKPDIPNADFF